MSAEEFSRSVARVVAAQLAEATGFDAAQDSAVEILADLLLRYLGTAAAGAHGYAELAGRSTANLADVLLSLEDVGVTPDDLHGHLELQKGQDVPFAHTLAPFPHTAAYAGHEGDPHKQRQSMLEAKQKAEAALNKLHQRISSRAAAAPGANPFLAPPAVEALPPPGGAGGGGDGAAAPPPSEQAQQLAPPEQQQPEQPEQQLLPPAAVAAEEAEDEEDALFEQAAVLRAFGSVLPPELVRSAKAARARAAAEELGVVEETPMDVDGGGAGSAWLEWKPDAQRQQQQQEGADQGRGAGGGEPLSFGIDPLAAGRRAALALASRRGPADAYAERARAAPAGAGGARQRRSRYDADPRVVQAEGILGAGPEAAFNVFGGAGLDGMAE
ncbi:Taf3 [Scenedesmus sp. PABB004]|nr:Taf3 [Scenedesmus sp. PABB004]